MIVETICKSLKETPEKWNCSKIGAGNRFEFTHTGQPIYIEIENSKLPFFSYSPINTNIKIGIGVPLFFIGLTDSEKLAIMMAAKIQQKWNMILETKASQINWEKI